MLLKKRKFTEKAFQGPKKGERKLTSLNLEG